MCQRCTYILHIKGCLDLLTGLNGTTGFTIDLIYIGALVKEMEAVELFFLYKVI